MKRNIFFILFILIFFSFEINGFQRKAPTAYVPDESTAIKIAEAVWFPIFGDNINNSKPFMARLQGDTLWIVTGTGPKSYKKVIGGDTILHMFHHGVPYIEITKCDGKILIATHSK
jgi:hypothetical protein